ncbi:hypothetical protein [Bradyrhizobium sp. AZCC 2289]|uniref:hypothetical protein n=1 Tax=Bradyrhizobium sp. AZCC 2289 TaxID=3117026 RepID=UPI0030208576
MTHWNNSGGHMARRCTESDDRRIADRHPPSLTLTLRRTRRRMRMPLSIALAAMLTAAAAYPAHARDPDGRYANSPLKQWFDSLKSGKGPCCSDADGTAVSDVDWESSNGHYRVRIEGEWVEVPDDAVITEPNRVGRTMVWPIRGYGGLTIRCFMPGSMT